MNENELPNSLAAVQSLEQCKQRITAALQDAGTHVVQVNQVLESLIGSGHLEPTMVLGDIIYEPRSPQGAGMGKLLQAAVGIGHGGVGVILWSANAYRQQLQSALPDHAPHGVKFSAYSDCPAELRQLLLPFLFPLIDRLIELARQ